MSAFNEFDEISVLIPGYSVEDLPTDLNEEPAASLLNAIAVAWHPALLARSRGIPTFRHAEAIQQFTGRHIVLVPQPSEDWLPHDWHNNIRPSVHRVLRQLITRDEWLRAVDELVSEFAPSESIPADSKARQESENMRPSGNGNSADNGPALSPGPSSPIEPVLVEQFLAFGIVHVLILLLSRRRHHYVDPDEPSMTREIRAAATASVIGDVETTTLHLKRCFELLQQTRELFYPLNCHLVDLCIPSATSDSRIMARTIASTPQLSLAATTTELVQWAAESPEFATIVRERVESGDLTLLTGHRNEVRSAIGSLSATWTDLRTGVADLRQAFGLQTQHWARRRFGMLASLPMLLRQQGFLSACHFALDDGLYPDRERAHFDWMATDGSFLAASSRIPLAIDSASSFLRLPDRLCESMQDDSSAALFVARLPDLHSPWLTDLRTAMSIAPVLGEFVTIAALMSFSNGNRNRLSFEHGEYLSPSLIQSAVLKTELPVSGPATLHALWRSIESLAFLRGLALMWNSHTPQDEQIAVKFSAILRAALDLEQRHCEMPEVNQDVLSIQRQQADQIDSDLSALRKELMVQLAGKIPQTASKRRGKLLFNTLPFPRTTQLVWPGDWELPATEPAIEAMSRGTQADSNAPDRDLLLHVRLPAGGFVWLTEAGESQQSGHPDSSSTTTTSAPHRMLEAARREPLLAEELVLRNQHFEVAISPRTGGIESVVGFGSRTNRFSQLVAFRYERDQKLPDSEDGHAQSTPYSVNRVIDIRVVSAGPLIGEIESCFEVLSPADHAVLAVCRQVIRVDRYRPRIDIRITFESVRDELKGNPWMTYFGSRFAWSNESAAITRSVLGQTAGFQNERFESPDYFEVADDQHRFLVCTHGRPYHRRTSPRMLDSILICEGETQREFRFTVELDQAFPMRTVSDIMTAPVVQSTADCRPSTAATASLLGVSAKNVLLAAVRVGTQTGIVPVESESPRTTSTGPDDTLPPDSFCSEPQPGHVRLLLMETEGLATECTIRTARRPLSAHIIRHDENTESPLEITSQGVIVPFGNFQLKEVDLAF